MEKTEPQKSKGIKRKFAQEILLIQKLVGYSFWAGLGVGIFCLFLFSPGKFDGEKFRKVKGSTAVNPYTNTVYSPLWWSDGFYEYCDGKVSFNPFAPQACYHERKMYLFRKSFRIGLYVCLGCIVVVLLYRYTIKGQKWVTENAS